MEDFDEITDLEDVKIDTQTAKEMTGINEDNLQDIDRGNLEELSIYGNEVVEEVLEELSDNLRETLPSSQKVKQAPTTYEHVNVSTNPLNGGVNGAWMPSARKLIIDKSHGYLSHKIAPTLLHEEWHADQTYRFETGDLQKTPAEYIENAAEQLSGNNEPLNYSEAENLLKNILNHRGLAEPYAQLREESEAGDPLLKTISNNLETLKNAYNEQEKTLERLNEKTPSALSEYSETINHLLNEDIPDSKALSNLEKQLEQENLDKKEREQVEAAFLDAYPSLKYSSRKREETLEHISEKAFNEIYSQTPEVPQKLPVTFKEGFAHAASLAYEDNLLEEESRENYLDSKVPTYSERLGEPAGDAIRNLVNKIADYADEEEIETRNEQIGAIHELQEQYAEEYWNT